MKKILLGVVAAATLGLAALGPSAASAHGYGYGHRHHYYGYRYYAPYCFVKRITAVSTPASDRR